MRTSEAPLHNMHSERALGMFDFQCHRAHNATVGFRDGKVKFAMNKTMTWLKTKPVEEQWRIVCFARRFAAKRRQEMMAREINISNASAERLKMMAQRRDNRQRSQLEKAIRDGTEDFTKVPPETKADCDLILAKSSTLIGRTLQHVWTDDQGDTVFEGKVMNIQGSIISILYSSESEATELSVYELVADIILGDASFLSD
ncbi:Transmembrane protein C17orf113 [Biomphalaria glabrata]|nr:Transmembrane protein C17orf113 [Biomphalaria glabrata]